MVAFQISELTNLKNEIGLSQLMMFDFGNDVGQQFITVNKTS